ncbi:MAG: biopolymer transporter ExbD [Thermoanaerobaculia bacterium]
MREKALHNGQTKLESAINVTPLVDVCLVLLVIFMIVTPLIKNPVDLPPAATGSPFAEEERQFQDVSLAVARTTGTLSS